MRPTVCVCVDSQLMRFITPLYNSIKSFCHDFDFYILCDKSVLKYKMQSLEKYAKIIYDVDIPEIDSRKLNGKCKIRSKAMYYRFIAPYLIRTDRLIYTDIDTIFNTDITELWNIDLNGNLVGAVCDPLNVASKNHFELQCNRSLYSEIGANYPYIFASGILLIDSKKWRECSMRSNMLNIWHKNPMLDMLLLNIACSGKILRLDDSWCVPINYMRGNQCVNTGKIYDTVKCWHWHGKKPWGLRSYSPYGREIYARYNYPI